MPLWLDPKRRRRAKRLDQREEVPVRCESRRNRSRRVVSELIGAADNVAGRTLLIVEVIMHLWVRGIKVARRASRLRSGSPPTGLEKRSARTERRTSARQFFAV